MLRFVNPSKTRRPGYGRMTIQAARMYIPEFVDAYMQVREARPGTRLNSISIVMTQFFLKLFFKSFQ